MQRGDVAVGIQNGQQRDAYDEQGLQPSGALHHNTVIQTDRLRGFTENLYKIDCIYIT